ncbi:hypothetical protein BBJ28_00016569 [Nothophytophthora sp. Chile5]|nr:hypothetical protein BBJ28_00016569 [Nothophytophthora sp. Chile5]
MDASSAAASADSSGSTQERSAAPSTATTAPAKLRHDQEELQVSDAPYAMAQATPNGAMKVPSTLPPIATARPLGNISQIQSHLPGGSNIPVNPNAPQPAATGSYNATDPNLPYVTLMTMAPSAVSGDADVDNMRFQFLQKCRWMAGFMLAYYLATFFFLQPFFVGVLGLLTGFMGYYGARPPMDPQRVKWLRWYIWCNYAMLLLNMWLLVVTLFFSGSMFSYSSASASAANSEDDDNSGMEDYMQSSYYYSSNLGLFVALLVAANMLIHLRGLHTAKQLLAELMASGIHHQSGNVVVLAPTTATSAV